MVGDTTKSSELIDMFNKSLEEEFLVTAQKCIDSKDYNGLLVVAVNYQHYIKYYNEFNTVLALTVREFELKKIKIEKIEQVTKIAYEHFIELEKKLVVSTKKFTAKNKARIIRAVREDLLWWVEHSKFLSQKDMNYIWNLIKNSIPNYLPYYCHIVYQKQK